ncbi:hypothetical protein P7C70_g2846, partial [Phenoliferia sp. Uapishka_3]
MAPFILTLGKIEGKGWRQEAAMTTAANHIPFAVAALWAGHRDAPLTNHGFQQASRLGAHFADVPITAIYCSDLKRARTTAKCILDQNKSDPKPPFTISTLLREQYFGKAEGEPWDAGKFHSAHLPWDDHRAFTLAEEAESLDDVGARADLALRHFIAPHILASSLPGAKPHHVVLVAHGIFLSECSFALKRAEDPNARFIKSGGYTNSAWSRYELEPLVGVEATTGGAGEQQEGGEGETFESPPQASAPVTAGTGPESQYRSLDSVALPPRSEGLPPPLAPTDSVPVLKVKVVAVNQTKHLEGLVRQKGGIGSLEHDAKQKKMQDYFSGKAGQLEEWKGKA